MLYVCVEGVSPLRRETSLSMLAAVLESEVPPPSRSGPLTPVLEALLEREPAARPDAARLAAMLAQVAAGGTARSVQRTLTSQRPVSHGTESGGTASHSAHMAGGADRREAEKRIPPRPNRRKRVAVSAVLAVLVAVGAALLVPRLLDGNGTDGDSDPTAGTRTSPNPTPTTTGRWIAQLHSEPVGSGTAARDAQLTKVRESVPEAVFVRSDAYASLRPRLLGGD